MSTTSAAGAANTVGSDYVLSPAWSKEADRLDAQYEIGKLILGRRTPVPSNIDLESHSRILDAAAGSLVWIRDVAEQPSIKRRLELASAQSEGSEPEHASASHGVKLYACDITSLQFPPKEIIDHMHIKTFLHDITYPFPKELFQVDPASTSGDSDLEEGFDLISMRLVVFAFDERAWMSTLKNFREILAPNGKVHLIESSLIWYKPVDTLSHSESTGMNHDITDSNHSHSKPEYVYDDPFSFVDDYNEIINRSLIQKKGYIPNLPTQLSSMVTKAQYQILSQTHATCYVGASKSRYQTQTQLLDSDVSKISKTWDTFDEGMITSLRTVFLGLFNAGILEGRNGKIDKREELDEFLERFERGVRELGVLIPFVEIVAAVDDQAEA